MGNSLRMRNQRNHPLDLTLELSAPSIPHPRKGGRLGVELMAVANDVIDHAQLRKVYKNPHKRGLDTSVLVSTSRC